MADQEKSDGYYPQDPETVGVIEAAARGVNEAAVGDSHPDAEDRDSNPEPPPENSDPHQQSVRPSDHGAPAEDTSGSEPSQPDTGDSETPPSNSDPSQPDTGDSEPPPSYSDPSQPDTGDSEPPRGRGKPSELEKKPSELEKKPSELEKKPSTNTSANQTQTKPGAKNAQKNSRRPAGENKSDTSDAGSDELSQEDPKKEKNENKTDPFSSLVNLFINMLSSLINGILKVVGMIISADLPKIPRLGHQDGSGIADGISEELNHKQALKDQIKNSQENTQTQKGSESPDDGNEASKLDQLNKYLGDQVASIKYDISTLGQFSIGIDDTAEVVDALARNELKRSDSGMLSTLSIATMDDAADRTALLKFASADDLADFYRVKVGLEGKIEKILGEKDVILAAGDDATRSLVDEVEVASKVLMGVNIETPETTFQTEPGLKAEESKVKNILENIEKEAGLKVEQSGRSNSKKASQGMS